MRLVVLLATAVAAVVAVTSGGLGTASRCGMQRPTRRPDNRDKGP